MSVQCEIVMRDTVINSDEVIIKKLYRHDNGDFECVGKDLVERLAENDGWADGVDSFVSSLVGRSDGYMLDERTSPWITIPGVKYHYNVDFTSKSIVGYRVGRDENGHLVINGAVDMILWHKKPFVAKIVSRKERGWGGHFYRVHECLFRRNTLLVCEDTRIVVSTVGSMFGADGKIQKINEDHYYETRVFYSSGDEYDDADIARKALFSSPWKITTPKSDIIANEMHEKVVEELSQKLSRGEKIGHSDSPLTEALAKFLYNLLASRRPEDIKQKEL